MRMAKAQAAAVYIDCPHCEESIADPETGSYMIQLDSPLLKGTPVRCGGCGKTSALPKTARIG